MGEPIPIPTLPEFKIVIASVAPALPTKKCISAPVAPTPEVVCKVKSWVVDVPPRTNGVVREVVPLIAGETIDVPT